MISFCECGLSLFLDVCVCVCFLSILSGNRVGNAVVVVDFEVVCWMTFMFVSGLQLVFLSDT